MVVFTSDAATVNALLETAPDWDVWAWDESLHIGFVSDQAELDAFSSERAALFRTWGWDASGEVDSDMILRNNALTKALDDNEEMVLLFGAGIRDQLTLARLCHFIFNAGESAPENTRLALLHSRASEYSGESLAERVGQAERLSDDLVQALSLAWRDFVSSDPTNLAERVQNWGAGIRKEAFLRLLKEFPSADNGLSLTEAQILDAVSLGVGSPRDLFGRCGETESIPFLSDWEYWLCVERLTLGETPLLSVRDSDRFLRPPKELAWKEFQNQCLELTDQGVRVAKGEENYTLIDYPERCLGGVRLKSPKIWYWDYQANALSTSPRVRSGM